MPTLEISESIFARLQKLAVPLIDTPATVLERLLDHYEHRSERPPQLSTTAPPPGPSVAGGSEQLNPDSPPDLRHTRVLVARFGSRTASGWNKLVHAAHAEAFPRLGSLESLRAATTSNLKRGRATSEDVRRGFRYLPEIDVSIQNVDAEHAWSNTLRLAKVLRVELTVDFEWMDKLDAARPGKKGRLAWRP